MATTIHPTAIVEDGAQLGVDCEIGAYAIVRRQVRLGDRSVVSSHAVIGGDPQFLAFNRQLNTRVEIGARVVIREYVTINRSIHEGCATVVGDDCFLMTGCHLGHDSSLGNHVVLANNVMLAGHVAVGDFAFIGGGSGVHQFARIGAYAMLSGMTRLSRDVAPFLLVAERDEVFGLNLVGMKRRGVSREAVLELKTAFREVFLASGNIRQLAAEGLASAKFLTPEAQRFLGFFSDGKRSFARPLRGEKGSISGDE